MATQITDPTHLTTLPDRIIVSGTTGSGKTMLGGELAATIGAPHVELDALHWEPNWTEAPNDVFRERVREATAGERWVVDSDYPAVRDIIWPRAELIVWLDYSLVRIYARLLRRTTRRVLTHEELWAGNRQRAGEAFFSGSALSFWTTRLRRNHAAHRGGCLADLARPEHAHLTVFRARSPREVETFVRGLAGRAQRAARNVGREGVAWQ